MKYLGAAETGKKWGVSVRRVLQYCKEERIPGAYRMGGTWAIPEDAPKPTDPRKNKEK